MKTHYASVPLTKACREGLKAVQEALAKDAEALNFRRSGMDDAHFTFSVFRLSDERKERQESEEQLITSVNVVLKDFLDKRPPIELKFGGLGSFGSQVFFIHITSIEEVAALRNDVNEVLEKEGLILADNKFTPHVTLFRARRGGSGGGGGQRGGGDGVSVSEMAQRTDFPPVAASPITEIVFKKLLGPKGRRT